VTEALQDHHHAYADGRETMPTFCPRGGGESAKFVEAAIRAVRIVEVAVVDIVPGVTRPRRQALSDGVYETVKALIMDHRIAPGERLNIDALARDLDVSPTPVREAMARLESDGLVTKRALAGYSVAPLLNYDALDQLFELRLLLEPHCAGLAASQAAPEAVTNLAALVEVFPKVGPDEDYQTYRAVAQADTAFHDLIIRASGRDMIGDTLTRLHAHMHMYRLWYRSGVAHSTHAEHARIVRAIRRGDAEAASAAMTAHLERSWKRVSRAGG